MKISIADKIRGIVSTNPVEVVHEHVPSPKVKPPRRRPSTQNVTDQSDYSKNYMTEYREEGKDYQKAPDAVKELKREQQKKLKEKFDL
jgi:hypothetical protein